MITGLIYKIFQKDKCYIGSTIRTPKERYDEHKRWSKYELHNSSSCKVLFNEYDILPELIVLDSIELLDLSYLEKKKLRDLEFIWINKTKNIVNFIKSVSNKNEYGKNRLKILENRIKTRYICSCGTEICSYSRKRHLLSKKHYLLLNNKKYNDIIKNIIDTNHIIKIQQ